MQNVMKVLSCGRGALSKATCIAAMVAGALTTSVEAQEWPNRPVAIVVPYPAGGPNDVLARVVARRLSESLGQQFIIENRVGAAGNIGANAVAKAKPDGYTLLSTSTGPQANNKFLYPALPYDPVKDFSSIVLISKSPVLFTSRKTAPFTNFAQLVAYAKANPAKLNIGTAGHGSVAHIASEFLQSSAGVKFTTVPYAGSTPLIQALMSEEIDLVSDLIPSHIPMLKDNRYNALLVASLKRAPSLPDVPTFAESGLPTFEASAWSALMAPAGTPEAIVARINAVVNDWIKSPDGVKQLATLEMISEGGTPKDLDTFIAAEIAKWGPIIQTAGIKAQP
jgi:tripartite-type tricarboxylate transporter receptor subunit TctC